MGRRRHHTLRFHPGPCFHLCGGRRGRRGRGSTRTALPRHGRAVQVDPIKPTSTPPVIKLLKLKRGKPLSIFAFNFDLRRYTMAHYQPDQDRSRVLVWQVRGRDFHSFTFQLNLSRVWQQNYPTHPTHPLTPPGHGLHSPYAQPLSHRKRSS
jgi:hypothetical protein